ncbi:hypothetical protein BX666DRAFT_2116350 [Dichotomocladium elegans]|nr:hypothetical protein BX666DRAFT_2116350 [Dichotomocladium elegans]
MRRRCLSAMIYADLAVIFRPAPSHTMSFTDAFWRSLTKCRIPGSVSAREGSVYVCANDPLFPKNFIFLMIMMQVSQEQRKCCGDHRNTKIATLFLDLPLQGDRTNEPCSAGGGLMNPPLKKKTTAARNSICAGIVRSRRKREGGGKSPHNAVG